MIEPITTAEIEALKMPGDEKCPVCHRVVTLDENWWYDEETEQTMCPICGREARDATVATEVAPKCKPWHCHAFASPCFVRHDGHLACGGHHSGCPDGAPCKSK